MEGGVSANTKDRLVRFEPLEAAPNETPYSRNVLIVAPICGGVGIPTKEFIRIPLKFLTPQVKIGV